MNRCCHLVNACEVDFLLQQCYSLSVWRWRGLSGNTLILIDVVTLPSTSVPVSTWMGDRRYLWMGKPSRHVAGHLGQLSLPSPGGG